MRARSIPGLLLLFGVAAGFNSGAMACIGINCLLGDSSGVNQIQAPQIPFQSPEVWVQAPQIPKPGQPTIPVATGNSCRYAFDGVCDEPDHCKPGTDSWDCRGGGTP